jgi:Rho-binding antiterminator
VSYQPIACDLYDQLEVLALHRQLCQVEYWNEHGESETRQTRLMDLLSRDRQEFVCLEAGIEVRLDALIRVLPVSG